MAWCVLWVRLSAFFVKNVWLSPSKLTCIGTVRRVVVFTVYIQWFIYIYSFLIYSFLHIYTLYYITFLFLHIYIIFILVRPSRLIHLFFENWEASTLRTFDHMAWTRTTSSKTLHTQDTKLSCSASPVAWQIYSFYCWSCLYWACVHRDYGSPYNDWSSQSLEILQCPCHLQW